MMSIVRCPKCGQFTMIYYIDSSWALIQKSSKCFGICAKCDHICLPDTMHKSIIVDYIDDMVDIKRKINEAYSPKKLLESLTNVKKDI